MQAEHACQWSGVEEGFVVVMAQKHCRVIVADSWRDVVRKSLSYQCLCSDYGAMVMSVLSRVPTFGVKGLWYPTNNVLCCIGD